MLIVLMGLPGAGKSTLARALERRLGFARVDRDAMPGRRFTAAGKRAATEAVWRRAAALLGRGRSVIVDGMTFASRAQRRRAGALARAEGARTVEVWLKCPVRLAQQRVLESGGHPATDRDAVLVRRVAARFAPVPKRVLRLDARASTGAQLRAVLERLRAASA